jgi:hypothetical protein
MALMTYLLKDRHGSYYFRRVVPPDLRAFTPPPWQGKANFERSLGTKTPSAAKIQASKALRECTVAFQTALRAKNGISADAKMVAHPITIEDIESDVIAAVLAADDGEREGGDDDGGCKRLRSEPSGLTSFPSPSTSRAWKKITLTPMRRLVSTATWECLIGGAATDL